MKQKAPPVFFNLKTCMVVLAFLSFHQFLIGQTADKPGTTPLVSKHLASTADSVTCPSVSSLIPGSFVRFDHAEEGYGFYMVKLSNLSSPESRHYFYEEARDNGIFMNNKGEIDRDSAFFITRISDQDLVQQKLSEFYKNSENNKVSRGRSEEKNSRQKLPFVKTADSSGNYGVESPLNAIPCTSAQVSCTGNVYSFPAGVPPATAPPAVGNYPNYGCLGSQPCPAWYFMQVGVAGDIIILIQQSGNHDVDFICWGPFTSLTDGCATGLTGTCNPIPYCCNNNQPTCTNFYPRGNITDCSFSGAATETCHILNAQVGEIYILLITNFSQQPGTITFQQTGGTGVTNCSIVVHCSMIAMTTNATACNALTNTFDVSGNVEFSNPPPGGTLTVTDITAVPQVSETLFPPFTSPLAYYLSGIPCDGATHTITAVFSDSTACTLSQNFNSPPASCPSAQISGGGHICNDGSSTTTVDIALTGVGPYNFTYAINGIPQTPVTGYNGPSPYVLTTMIPGTYTLVSISNSVCIGTGPVSGSAIVISDPLPIPSISGNNLVCDGSQGNIYTTQAGNTNYTWTISAGGIITAGGASTNNTVTVTWNTPGTKTVRVSYTDVNGCTAAAPAVYTVMVNPLPVTTISGNNNPCEGTTGLVYQTEAGMTNYQWSVSSGGLVTGGGATTDSTITITWNTAGNQSVSVHYQPGPNCTSSFPTLFNVTVKPLPVITNVNLTDSICSGTFPVIMINSSILGTIFNWIGANTAGNVTGYSLSGTVNPISETLTNTLFSLGEVEYSVTPSINGCTGITKNFMVEIKPKPDVYFQPASDTICSSQSTSTLILSHVPGTIYSWTASGGPGISGYSGGAGNSIRQPLYNAGYTQGTATYLATPTAASCVGLPNTTLITVFPIAAVSYNICTDTITVTDAKPFPLKGGIPLGGTYTGAGVDPMTGIFTPASAGTGLHVITYTYLNHYSCPNSATLRINVQNPAAFNCGDQFKDIRDNKDYPTLSIGSQCWMTANLNYGNYLNSTIAQRENCLVEKYCKNEIASNCVIYGGLYQWDEMMQYQDAQSIQGICPPGWHIPAEAEWNTLFTNFMNNGFAGAALKSSGFSGFNAFSYGMDYLYHSWNFFGFATMIWSSTSHGPLKAWAHGMNNPNPSVSFYPGARTHAFSVRCVKD